MLTASSGTVGAGSGGLSSGRQQHAGFSAALRQQQARARTHSFWPAAAVSAMHCVLGTTPAPMIPASAKSAAIKRETVCRPNMNAILRCDARSVQPEVCQRDFGDLG
jgi:hypothetical protein